MINRDQYTSLALESIKAEIEAEAAALAAAEAAKDAEQQAMAHLQELPLMKGEFPVEVIEGLCRSYMAKIVGRPRTKDDVVACVRYGRNVLRDVMDKAYENLLAERAGEMYSALIAQGIASRVAQKKVGETVYGPKQAKRQATLLPKSEEVKLWDAAKKAAFPQNYKREGQVWMGWTGEPWLAVSYGIPILKNHPRQRMEKGWVIIPISQPAKLGEHPSKLPEEKLLTAGEKAEAVAKAKAKDEADEKAKKDAEAKQRVRPLGLLESLHKQGLL